MRSNGVIARAAKQTMLFACCVAGQLCCVAGAIAQHTSLREAVEASDTDSVLELLRSGVEPNMEDEDGKTPLHWARSAEMVRALLQFGADPNARDENDVTPLHDSVDLGFKDPTPPNPAASRLLLQAGADPNARDINGKTPLFYAADKDQEVVAALLEADADPNARDIEGRTPLFYVQNHQVAAVLLQAGADPNVHDAGQFTSFFPTAAGYTPLHAIADRCFDAETIEVLAHGGADTNASDANGRTPLFETVQGIPAKSCAAALLNAGANPDATDANGFSALHILTLADHPAGLSYDNVASEDWAHEMATVLLDGGASLFVANDDGYPPLAAAMYHGKPHAKITDTILRYHFPTLDSEDPPDSAHSILSSLGPGLHRARCWFNSEQAWPMKECFFMVVAEDQNDADSPLIAFPVVRYFEQSSPQAPRNPILHLGGGGPGSAMGLENPQLIWMVRVSPIRIVM